MLKNLKLSSKMFLGFGCLIVLTAVLSGTGWFSLHRIDRTAETANSANQQIIEIESLRQHEKNFLANGFATADGETQNAAEKWRHGKEQLVQELTQLSQHSALKAEHRTMIREADAAISQYQASFESLVGSRKQKDDAFASWGKLGWDITNSINEAKDNVITPALNKAYEAQDVAHIKHWASIKQSMDEDFIQNFLVLRICGIYLVATDKDAQWQALCKQLDKTKAGLTTWTANVQGESALETAAGIQTALTCSVEKLFDK